MKEDYRNTASPWEQGVFARLEGRTDARNPHHPSSSAYEAWQAGYDGE